MTPASTTRVAGGAAAAPRCEHTQLNKPECHCSACLAAMVATRGAPPARA